MLDDIDALYEYVLAQTEREKYNHWLTYMPYPKQREFMDLGLTYMERLLIAGNQTGKSDAGAYETARHMTGVYPDWWKGRRYDQNTGPCDCWVGGTSGDAVRDGPQGKLFGMPGVSDLFGTGFIPKDCIVGEPTHSRSATNLIDTAFIRHVSGAVRPISFKTYKQSREDWQGPTKNFMWFDEEPPLEIYTEGLARMAATAGSHILTFTPLYGFSDVVKRFLECPVDFAYRRAWVQMALTDAAHMTPDKIAITLSIYPEHEWPARRDGDPHLAGGLVFTTNVKALEEEPYSLGIRQPGFPVPPHWRVIWGIDFGVNHPFAAVLMGIDLEGPKEVGHVLHSFRTLEPHPIFHAEHMRMIGANVPVAWPHDGHVRDKGGDQTKVKDIYKGYKLNMLAEHATHPDGGYATEPALFDINTAMREGRFKVNRLLSEWFQECRLYHRSDGKDGHTEGEIIKKGDDIMSATRIAWMARRHARAVPLGSTIIRPRRNLDGRGDEFDPISGRRLRL